jgi:hypothetical protein
VRPLDSLHSIKLKLGVVIVAAVLVTVGVVRLGERLLIPGAQTIGAGNSQHDVAAFTVLGLLGMRFAAPLIVGYALHGAWDLLHELHAHLGTDTFGGRTPTEIPLAYGAFCATFDWIVAVYFYLRRDQWRAARA